MMSMIIMMILEKKSLESWMNLFEQNSYKIDHFALRNRNTKIGNQSNNYEIVTVIIIIYSISIIVTIISFIIIHHHII